jgi:hypothetical protein
MATLHDITTARKPQYRTTHYAYLRDIYGTAEFLSGSGYLFRAEGERQATLVSYRDPALMLLGRLDVAQTQHELDTLLGGPALIACSREEGRQ